jgi:MerR family regulatory protein
MRPLTIGTLANAAGVHLETVRYYERIGLMPKPSRTASNYRNYEPEHIERLCLSGARARSAFPPARSRNCSLSPNRAEHLAPRFKR